MRLLEILMMLAILPVLVWPLLPRPRPRWVDFLPGTAVVLMIIHLVFEGYRWQMLPAYALIVIVFLATLSRLRYPAEQVKQGSGWMMAGSVIGLLVWGVALLLPYALPASRLPQTTGPYAIGTKTFHLMDDSRDEIYTADPFDRREIMMQLWYPAAADAQGETAVYLEDLSVMGPELAERLGLPAFLLDHINLVELDAKKDVPILAGEGPYPVLVFSHGLRGMRGQNTAMVRELVSQGFVVAAIDHTYGNLMTVFPDGRVAFYTPEVFSEEGDPPHNANTLVKVWAADMGFVLDELAAWTDTAGQAFDAQLDLSRVGVFGHSTDGGAAVEFCGSDARCQAGVGLDAWVEPVSEAVVVAGLERPFLFLRAARWEFNDLGSNFDIADALLAGARDTAYMATIEGAAHYDFSDIPLLSPLTPQLGLSGEIENTDVVEMVTAMTAAFFGQELLGDEEKSVMGAMIFPEMSLVGNGK